MFVTQSSGAPGEILSRTNSPSVWRRYCRPRRPRRPRGVSGTSGIPSSTGMRASLALAIAVISTRGDHARAQRPEARVDKAETPQEKASLWMKHKLIASQKILEGMTRGDYELIENSAQGMRVMGYLEGWVRADMPGYKEQLRAFEHANGAIVRHAHDENLDGVTLAYTQLAISCVQCHKLVRDNVRQ